MATLNQMSNFTPAIHSTTRRYVGRRYNGNVPRVSCGFSSPTPEKNSTVRHDAIPRVEDSPFRKSLLTRGMPEPPPIQKAESDIMDYCSTLEGDEGYQCWEAYFEFENLKKEYVAEAEAEAKAGHKISNPLEKLEKLVRLSGGVKNLIERVHLSTKMSKMHKESEAKVTSTVSSSNNSEERKRPFPEPDGLPKTQTEMEEEEKALMPDSSYTKLLRRVGRGVFPAWFTPRPDHETD